MAQNISVPDIGDFKDVEVIEVLVKPGDQINKNDPIVTIESDKSSVEIPSPAAGESPGNAHEPAAPSSPCSAVADSSCASQSGLTSAAGPYS